MTGNLGKFSTEPAADGGGIKMKRREQERKRERGRKKRSEGGGNEGTSTEGGRAQTTWHGLSWVWEQDNKWVSRFQSEERGGIGGGGRAMEGWGCAGRRRRRRLRREWKSSCWRCLIILFICSRDEISKAHFYSISLSLLRLKDQAEDGEENISMHSDLLIYADSDLFTCLSNVCFEVREGRCACAIWRARVHSSPGTSCC